MKFIVTVTVDRKDESHIHKEYLVHRNPAGDLDRLPDVVRYLEDLLWSSMTLPDLTIVKGVSFNVVEVPEGAEVKLDEQEGG